MKSWNCSLDWEGQLWYLTNSHIWCISLWFVPWWFSSIMGHTNFPSMTLWLMGFNGYVPCSSHKTRLEVAYVACSNISISPTGTCWIADELLRLDIRPPLLFHSEILDWGLISGYDSAPTRVYWPSSGSITRDFKRYWSCEYSSNIVTVLPKLCCGCALIAISAFYSVNLKFIWCWHRPILLLCTSILYRISFSLHICTHILDLKVNLSWTWDFWYRNARLWCILREFLTMLI